MSIRFLSAFITQYNIVQKIQLCTVIHANSTVTVGLTSPPPITIPFIFLFSTHILNFNKLKHAYLRLYLIFLIKKIALFPADPQND